MDDFLSIVTAVYDTPPLIDLCLNAVAKNTDVPYEHILVYNHPPYPNSWETVERLSKELPNIRIIDFGENVGVNKAYFSGFAEAKGNWFCKLDNDTIVPPKWASKMIKALKDVPDLFYLSSDLDKDRQKWASKIVEENGHRLEIMLEGKVTFSCVIWPRDKWELAVKAFPQQLNVYYGNQEEYFLDLCNQIGWKAAHYPEVVCEHLARTELTDRDYGDWKLCYFYRQTRLPFEEWRRQRYG